jgi:hypothetical protein
LCYRLVLSCEKLPGAAGEAKNRRGKRTRAAAEEKDGEWETPEGWTGLICGLQELVVPVYQHCRQKVAEAEKKAEVASAGRRKGKKPLKAALPVLQDASEANDLLEELLPSPLLLQLLQKAPTFQVWHLLYDAPSHEKLIALSDG